MTRHALLTACDRGYLPGAAAMLASARRHHPDVERVCLVPDADVDVARETLGGLTAVRPAPRRVGGVVDGWQMGHVRLFAAEMAEFESVLWADSDLLFCRPVPELFRVPAGRVLAAPCHPSHRVERNLPEAMRPRFIGLFPHVAATAGFNSGIFALRPADWPDLVPQFERTLAEFGPGEFSGLVDQGLLNALFFGRVDYLGMEFNWSEMFDAPPDPYTVRVVHYCSRPKPWESNYPKHEPGYWFWVEHGLGETDPAVLRAVRRRILLHTPRRRLAQLVRRVRAAVLR